MIAAEGREEPVSYEDSVPITARALLVVEGRDEQRFLEQLMEHQGWSGVQVLPMGGKKQLPVRLDALVKTSGFANVRGLAILRDANSDPRAAFQSVCTALGANHLPVPTASLEWIGDAPAVAVMIVPSVNETGSLEASVSHPPRTIQRYPASSRTLSVCPRWACLCQETYQRRRFRSFSPPSLRRTCGWERPPAQGIGHSTARPSSL